MYLRNRLTDCSYYKHTKANYVFYWPSCANRSQWCVRIGLFRPTEANVVFLLVELDSVFFVLGQQGMFNQCQHPFWLS